MAYDPKDPADKKIVDDAVAAALADAAETHEADIAGLKTKNTKLIADLKAAKAGNGGDDNSAEVERLEGELANTKKALQTAEKTLKTTNTQLEAITGERDGLNKDLSETLVGQGLTDALVGVNVDKKFLPAVKSLLAPQVKLEIGADGKRQALVGTKPLGDFVKEWSLGDEGKPYISAGGNSGGGAGGSQGGQGTGKTTNRAGFEAMSQTERMEFSTSGGTVTD